MVARDDTRRAADSLRARVASTTDVRVKQDLAILIRALDDNVTSSQLQRGLMLDYINVGEIEFSGIQALLDPQVPKERQAAAVKRLRKYAGLEPGTAPLTQLAMERTRERFDVPGLTGAYVDEVKKGLDDTKHY